MQQWIMLLTFTITQLSTIVVLVWFASKLHSRVENNEKEMEEHKAAPYPHVGCGGHSESLAVFRKEMELFREAFDELKGDVKGIREDLKHLISPD